MNNLKTVNIQYLESEEERDRSKTMQAGKFLWPGFTHVYNVFAKQLSGGKYRYQTGLDLQDFEDDKKPEIEEAIKYLENHYGKGVLDPFNDVFWRDISIKLDKKNIFLDITNNAEHKLLYYVIKSGGIQEIAGSYNEAVEAGQPKKWFMVEPEELADISVQSDRISNKAIAKLEYLDEERTFEDMMLIHKVLITSDRGVTKNTPKGTIYKDLSDFISGKILKTNKKQTPKQFIDAVELIKSDKKKLYITAYVKEAVYFNFITPSEDGGLVNTETRTKYGASQEKAIAFLTNPINQEELDNIKERVEKKWSE